MIRPATTSEIATIQLIEDEAGEVFRSVGMDDVADDPPPSVEELRKSIEHGRLLVYAAGDDVVAYISVESVDDECHIAQVSVLPSHAGLGIGRKLIDEASRLAKASGQRAVTLTAFRDVPWNAPYYERLGFKIIEGNAVGPELKEAFDRDDRFMGERVCMRRSLE